MKVGDLVRYKKSAIRSCNSDWVNHAAKEKKPMLVLGHRNKFAVLFMDGRIFYGLLEDLTTRGIQ